MANAICLIPLDFSKCKFLNSFCKSSIMFKIFYTQEIHKVKTSTTTFMCLLQMLYNYSKF